MGSYVFQDIKKIYYMITTCKIAQNSHIHIFFQIININKYIYKCSSYHDTVTCHTHIYINILGLYTCKYYAYT